MPQVLAYTDQFKPDFGIPYDRDFDAKLQALSDKELFALLEFKTWLDRTPNIQPADLQAAMGKIPSDIRPMSVRYLAEKNAQIDPVQWGYTLDSWRDVNEDFQKYRTHCLFGGNRACLRGDEEIYDPVLGISRRVDSIEGEHHVYAWNGFETVIAKAAKPFKKPSSPMLRIRLESGESFVCSEEHLVFCADGLWRNAGRLRPGVALFRPPSISDNAPLGQPLGARHSTGTPEDSRADCHPSPHSDGEPLHQAEDTDRESFQPQVDAPRHTPLYERICRSLWLRHGRFSQDRMGAQAGRFRHSLIESSDDLRAILDGPAPNEDPSSDRLSRASCRLYRSAWQLCAHQTEQVQRQSIAESCPPQSKPEFHQLDKLWLQFASENSTTITAIEKEEIAAIWDFSVPECECYIHKGIVHHNTKSSYAAMLCMHLALTIPEFQARCYHVNEEKSVAEQQSFLYEALPQRFKQMGKKRGQHFTVQYTQQNGFTNGKLIIPPLPGYKRGGEIIFQNYEQYKNNAQIVEGFWAHFIWTDEEVPIKMYERLLTRLGDANGRLLMTFTTIQGWSALVAEILGKTKTLRKRRAPLLGNKEIPTAQESLSRRNTRIHYFWTEDNPFIPPAWIGELLQGRPESEIKAVAYGIPTKSATTPFPHFSEEIHVLPASQMPWLNRPEDEDEPPEFTRYHVIDPAGSKPWFMIWAAVDAKETIYVYAESPESTTWGPWAEPGSTMEGKAGPAQKPNGYGIPDYIDIMHSEEATPEGSEVEMKVFERVIDSRLGAATTQTAEGATSIISELEKADITVVPAPGLNIEHGLQLINTYLKPEGFDPSKPVGPLNHPKLFISDRCQSLIFCLKEYTAKGGKDEATKDPVDCIRMLLENGANFIPKAAQKGKASTFSY